MTVQEALFDVYFGALMREHFPQRDWNTQTANQAVGTGWLVLAEGVWMLGSRPFLTPWSCVSWPDANALRRAWQSARIAFGAL